MANSIYLYEVIVDPETHKDTGAWQLVFENRLEQLNYNYERKSNRLRIWDTEKQPLKTKKKGVVYREGVEVFKVSMPKHYQYPVVGFNFARLYFIEGDNYPAYQSSKDLFNDHEIPDVLRQIPLIEMLDDFIGLFNKDNQLISKLTDIDWSDVSENVVVKGTSRETTVDRMSANQYASAILGLIRNNRAIKPVEIEFTLIDAFAADENKSREVASMTSAVLEKEWGCSLTKKKISSREQFDEWLNASENTHRIGFFALDGKKGDRPTQNAIEWMRHMEQSSVPYVLFSAARDVKPVYTRHGNALHMLNKMGGIHYFTFPKSIPDYEKHWFIGLDLGFGAQYKGKCVVVTLTDNTGALRCYWRAIKNSDETLTEDILNEAITWILKQAEELDPDRNIVVIRDGRCPHNELIGTYKKLLPEGRSIFIEYTKKGNPILVDDNQQPKPGTMAVPSGSAEAFLFTARSPQKAMLTNTTRFRCRINDMDYTLEQIGAMLISLCFAPKLSMQPSSLPSPIYWADGIASISNTNLQFAGWGHLPHVTRDFR